MNRNTWIIIIVAVIVIIGLIWTVNRGTPEGRFGSRAEMICLSSMEQDGQSYCTSMVRGYPMKHQSEVGGQ